MPAPQTYVGRFAPSPSGPLHLGSLVCALASYLDAQYHQGRWLVRIEDIDPPREQPGAAAAILTTLEAHGLVSEQPVLWQSQRANAYHHSLQYLAQRGLTYPCNCSRARLASLQGRYDGHCATGNPGSPHALRLRVPAAQALSFEDRHLGMQHLDLALEGDFIVHRKDGLFAYQLAVVVDDIYQGITHVVRGSDLLDATFRQLHLFACFGHSPPQYAHIPVITTAQGYKLSKQNRAPALDNQQASRNLWRALWALGLAPEQSLSRQAPQAILAYAREHWHPKCLPPGRELPESLIPHPA
jgi:glutamyl-Q tRNA(Asp) synthetase